MNGMTRTSRRALCGLVMLASSATAAFARSTDDPITAVSFFHMALLDGNVGAVLSQPAMEAKFGHEKSTLRGRPRRT